MPDNRLKRSYGILWTGQAVSLLTSSILQMALIWRLAAKTQSALVLSLASIAGFLPNALLGMLAGALVDRVSRKTAMICADLFIAAVSLALVFASLAGEPPVWLILLILALRSVGTAFHTPAISAATPLLVPPEHLTRCAGYTQSLQTVSYILGTAAAGALYPVWSISAMVALDVAGALIASLAVMLIPIPKVAASLREERDRGGLLRQTREGFQIFRARKGMLALLVTAAVFMVLFSPVNALFPLMSLGHFGGTTVQASIAEIAFSLGMLGGGLLLGVKGDFRKKGFLIPFSVALIGLPICISGLLPPSGFWVFSGLCVLMGLSAPLYNGPVTALMQTRIPPEYLGRAFGLYGSVASLSMPVGLALSGLFADRVGTPAWFAITGALLLLLAAGMYLIPSLRTIDELDYPPPPRDKHSCVPAPPCVL